jgi:hypothetical protein
VLTTTEADRIRAADAKADELKHRRTIEAALVSCKIRSQNKESSMSKRKNIEPTDVRNIEYGGEIKTNINDDGIEEINRRAEDSVEDYEWGPKWLPGKNIAGESGPSDG